MAKITKILILVLAVIWQSISINALTCYSNKKAARGGMVYSVTSSMTCEKACQFYVKNGYTDIKGYMTYGSTCKCITTSTISGKYERGWKVCTFGAATVSSGNSGNGGGSTAPVSSGNSGNGGGSGQSNALPCYSNKKAARGGMVYSVTSSMTCEEACQSYANNGYTDIKGYMTYGSTCKCITTSTISAKYERGWKVCTFGAATVSSGNSGNGGGSTAPVSSGNSGNGGGSTSDARKACLDQHNVYRARHGVPLLKWSDKLANEAQQWANYLASIGKLVHSTGEGYGENLAYAMDSRGVQDLGKEAVVGWYEEICEYNGCDFSYDAGHFTQVVWKGTTHVGCAVAKTGSKVFTVGRYTPSGNYRGQGNFQSNVGCGWSNEIRELRNKVDCNAYFRRKQERG